MSACGLPWCVTTMGSFLFLARARYLESPSLISATLAKRIRPLLISSQKYSQIFYSQPIDGWIFARRTARRGRLMLQRRPGRRQAQQRTILLSEPPAEWLRIRDRSL